MANAVRLLHVDGDSSFRDETAKRLEHLDPDVAVISEADPEAALERLADAPIDCVVTEWRLPEGDGLALLEAVREREPDLPVVVFTGEGSEAIASEAIGMGADDYLRKGSEDPFERLAERVRGAVTEARHREPPTTIDRVQRVVRDIHEVLVRADDAATLKAEVCEVLTASDPYVFAWIGAVADESAEIVPEAVAGVDEGYVETITVTADDSETGAGPGGRAVRTGELQVIQDIREDDAFAPWREAASERGVRSVATIPLAAAGQRHGVLGVYADRAEAFGESERTLLSTIGESVALALERVALHEAVQEAKRRYEGVVEAAPEAILIADRAGTILEANRAAGDLFECDPSALVGRDQETLHPDGATERYRRYFEDHADESFTTSAFDDGSQMLVETTAGRQVPVEITSNPLALGDRTLVLGLFRDISDQRFREEAIEQLLTTSERLVSARSREAVAETAAEAAKEILGFQLNGIYLRDEEGEPLQMAALTERSRQEIGSDQPDIPPGEGLVWEAIEAGRAISYDDVRQEEACLNPETVIRSEIHVPLGENGVLMAGSTAVGAFDEDDVRVLQLLGANTRSAFERVEREQRLETNEAELSRQNERLLQFASVLSHDLRNPLNVASLRTELAADANGLPADIRDHLAQVQGAHERMERIIDDLLWLAKEGQDIGDTDPVSLADVAQNAWSSVSTADATLEVPETAVITADKERLRQLLENLFRNAIDHCGPDVRVRVVPLAEGFRVEDSGPGLPEDTDDLFEPGVSTAANGTGLGLSIVDRIARAHDWTIDVGESDAGGARFEFRPADA
jgi:PAS domain S-box-containing protein